MAVQIDLYICWQDLRRKLLVFDLRELVPDSNILKSAAGCHEIRGKTLGIIGYGHIGSQLSILAESMGLRVRYHDIALVMPLGNSKKADTLDQLLSTSDFISLHVPLTPQTENMITAREIGLMKKGSFLLNASR